MYHLGTLVTLGFLCVTSTFAASIFDRLEPLSNLDEATLLKQSAYPIPYIPDEFEERGK